MGILKTKTSLEGVYEISPIFHSDKRGTFIKHFTQTDFEQLNLMDNCKETFYSISHKNVIRGMHFQQPPHAHHKLVYAIQGEIIDVVLDLRKKSSTYGKYYTACLNETNNLALYIPIGCAHGFLSKSEKSTVMYHQSTPHHPDSDSGIAWNSFGYDWGIDNPIISDRDQQLPKLHTFNSPF